MSYRLRLIITISLLIAVTFSAGCSILICASFETALETEIAGALESFESVQNTLYLLTSVDANASYKSLASALEQMEEENMGRWQALILTRESQSVYRSNPQALEGYALPHMGGGQCGYLRVEDGYGRGMVVQGSLTAGGERLTLRIRFDLSRAYGVRQTQLGLYQQVYLVVMLFGVATAVILSFALTRRLHRLTTAVRKISGGDLSTRSRIRTQDEFGQLSRDFDAMADKLQENISRLETDIERQENFMGAFAHELKTPMTSIIGFADLLRQGNLDENTRMMASEYIYSEGHRLERLSFKLLELLLLKKDAIVMKRVNLNAFVAEVERALGPNLRNKNIKLVCRSQTKRVSFEPDLVKSLLYNLIDNAGKAMDGGGLIALVATAVPGGCQFQVVDNGRGMEESELTRITEAFYRVDKSRSRKQGGAGLGLALCKQIVELHNGDIHFESHMGKGTRITVTLYGRGGKPE